MTPAARSITAGRSRLGAARSTSGRREAARFPEADGAARRGRQRPRRACRLPASDGRAKLTSTAVADVGCGLGASSVLLAQAYWNATIVGSNYHRESVDIARTPAADAVQDGARYVHRALLKHGGAGTRCRR
jgi:2-polyprenyl-3-methyl-5-hydroxy-6-metoxy-1,4-benzoquinol methylase